MRPPLIHWPAAWSPECWSLRYAADRLLALGWCALHPGRPWLTRQANRVLAQRMTGRERVLEFGSGRSTIWFARHAAHVLSIEHQPQWEASVRRNLRRRGLLERVELRLVAADQAEHAAADVPEGAVDLLLIDGIRRAECLRAALPTLKSGGTLVIDNINRHIPCDSRGPGTLREWPPSGSPWQPLAEMLRHWEHTWTTDGVTDTWVGAKPHIRSSSG